ncbi:hypothetical protein RE474_06675 [Methanolobus sediminis]|uniref:DUF4064 domain-containing protein n=1 Tax=Methanolobus sediminis TaxID=3072978 RepID=A0AA51UQ23_9EURY|nr:hypothetical protein [Methanolobus sediminis]WMW26386.1 hypothetical protein RE474_06675 [Methanolobus sediminis]
MTENRGRYLAIIGGILGICVSLGLFSIIKGIIPTNGIGFIYGVTPVLGISDPDTVLAIYTFSSTALAVIGIIAAYRLSKNVRNSALIIIASGLAGFLFMSYLWFPAGFLLVLGGILLMRDRKIGTPA